MESGKKGIPINPDSTHFMHGWSTVAVLWQWSLACFEYGSVEWVVTNSGVLCKQKWSVVVCVVCPESSVRTLHCRILFIIDRGRGGRFGFRVTRWGCMVTWEFTCVVSFHSVNGWVIFSYWRRTDYIDQKWPRGCFWGWAIRFGYPFLTRPSPAPFFTFVLTVY